MNRPPASYLNSSVMGNYLLNWIGLITHFYTFYSIIIQIQDNYKYIIGIFPPNYLLVHNSSEEI